MTARARTAATTLVLLVVAAVALAWGYFGVEKKAAAERAAKDREEKVFSFAPAQVKELTLRAKGEVTRAARTADGWRIVAPVAAPADRAALDGLVERLAALRRSQEVAPAGATALARYGLETPRARADLVLDGGATETLALGDENPFDRSAFARTTAGAVVVVPGDVKWAMERSTFELRDKRLLPLDEDAIARVDVAGRNPPYALARVDGRWTIAVPSPGTADADAAARILGALRNLRATAFLPAGDPKAHGLDRPRLSVKVTGRDGAVRSLTVGEVAASREQPTRRFARVDSAPEVAAVPQDALAALEIDPADLRDRTVLAFEREAVVAIRLAGPDGTVELRKSPGKDGAAAWELTAPRAARADASRVGSLLWALSSLRADRIAGEGPAAAGALPAAARTISLLGEGGKEVARLEIAAPRDGKALVRSSTGPRLMEVDRAALDGIPSRLEDLEEKPPDQAAAPKRG